MKHSDYSNWLIFPLTFLTLLLFMASLYLFPIVSEVSIICMMFCLYFYSVILTKILFKKWIFVPLDSSIESRFLSSLLLMIFCMLIIIVMFYIFSLKLFYIRYYFLILMLLMLFPAVGIIIRNFIKYIDVFRKTVTQLDHVHKSVEEIFSITNYLDTILRPKISDEQREQLQKANISETSKLGEVFKRNQLDDYMFIMLNMPKESVKHIIDSTDIFKKVGNNRYLRASADKFITDYQNGHLMSIYNNLYSKNKANLEKK